MNRSQRDAVSLQEARECADLALDWLANSGMRTSKGGYRSEFDPLTGRYLSWGGGEDCTSCTAGAILAFLRARRHIDRALESGEHLLDLALNEPPGASTGAIPMGERAPAVDSYFMAVAIQALLALHHETGEEDYFRAARKAGEYVVSRLVDDARGITAYSSPLPSIRATIYRLHTLTEVWLGEYVKAFRLLYLEKKVRRWLAASEELADWLVSVQNHDGSFFKARLGVLGRVFVTLETRDPCVLVTGWDRRTHATSQTTALEALVLSDRHRRARAVSRFLASRLCSCGLLHETLSKHDQTKLSSPDVMPSAQYGLLLMKFPHLHANALRLTTHLARGLVSCQARNGDVNERGGIRGLPTHRTRGNSLFVWDTAYASMFLSGWLENRSDSTMKKAR